MHAYLLTGTDKDKVLDEAKNLSQKLSTTTLEFPIAKISDVRQLGRFLKLRVNQTTTILIQNIDNATHEALNAFLKNLEEPQKNVNFILTANSEHKVIPTIVSRCQIIRISSKGWSSSARKKQESGINNYELEDKFLNVTIGEKLFTIDKLRSREEAKGFMENVIHSLHAKLLNESKNQKTKARLLKYANQTFLALNANGNVGLQLTNFVINFD